MDPELTVRFFDHKPVNDAAVRSVRGFVGLYFIYLTDRYVEYPLSKSHLIYIGMSESSQTSIENRLRDHASGQSGNPGLTNYIRTGHAHFTYLSFDLLSVLGIPSIAELEGAFLRAFLATYGCYPICNNQCGMEMRSERRGSPFRVDWRAFE